MSYLWVELNLMFAKASTSPSPLPSPPLSFIYQIKTSQRKKIVSQAMFSFIRNKILDIHTLALAYSTPQMLVD